MKNEQRDLSIALRKEGKSIREIQKIVKCSHSSVSRWISHVELTEQQKIDLFNRNPIHNGKYKFYIYEAAKRNKQRAEIVRKKYRRQGAKIAEKLDPLHVSACMLYWAEGTKTCGGSRLVNSDPKMLKLFIRFLEKYFSIGSERISIYINCYTDVHNLEEIENHWLAELNLPRSCLRKGQVNYFSSYSKNKKKGKCPFGTCALNILKPMEVFEHIMGALEFYQGNLT